MNEADYNKLVARLPELTRDQLADLRRRSAFLLGHKEKSGGIKDQDWLLAGLIQVLNDRGLESTIPANFRIKNNRSFAAYTTQADRVMQLLSQAIPNMSATERLGIGVLAARALADYLQEWSSVSLESMLRNVSRIPEAIDAAFPGYIGSGLLSFVLTSRRVSV